MQRYTHAHKDIHTITDKCRHMYVHWYVHKPELLKNS